MSRLAFTIDDVHIDPPGLAITNRAQAAINIDGMVAIAIDGEVVFREDVNFVEMMYSLVRWRDGGCAGDYGFDSSDFEETGLIRFQRQGGGYQFASCWRAEPHPAVLAPAAVEAFIAAFAAVCAATVRDELGVDLEALPAL